MTFYTNPSYSNWQEQIIRGTILGGSSIIKPVNGRNCYLIMRSSNEGWLNYKALELKKFCNNQNCISRYKDIFIWRSSCYPIFNDYYKLFYKDGEKMISMESLNPLRDIGLAIWFVDSGVINDKKVTFNLAKYGENNVLVVKKYFNLLGFDIEKGKKLILTEESSNKFLKITAHCLPKFVINQYDNSNHLRKL